VPPETLPAAEVVVNVERAVRAGPRYGGPSRELARYLAHGCQHLGGATDGDRAGRARMHRRERAWLAEAEGLHLLDGLTRAGEKRPHS
jgi:ssRNA-specific RNase YbeY (16S rRNA maturation enzyme)